MDVFEEAVHGFEHLFHHHRTPAAPAAEAVTINTTPGGPVSSLSDTLHNIAAKVEHYDDETLQALDAVKANPATADAFTVLRDLTGFNVDPSVISLATSVLAELRNRLAAAAQPQQPAQAPAQAEQPTFTPSGPVVAGQA